MSKYLFRLNKKNIIDINHFKIEKILTDDCDIVFYADDKFLKYVNEKDIEHSVINVSKRRFKSFISKYLVTLIGIIFLFFGLISMSISITNVKFTDDYYYSDDIYDFVSKKLKKIGLFYYLTCDINTINSDLRSEFYQYEWIGISKKGTIIYIDARINKNTDVLDNNETGNYYASNDAIVKSYHLEKGIVLVQEEQYVTKGDLLISGKIVHYNNEIESIHPIGYVIGEVLEYQDFLINKEEVSISRTGRIFKDNVVDAFGKLWFKSPVGFTSYDTEYQDNFSILNLFNFKKIYYYELKEIRYQYTIDEAIELAKSMVYRNFNSLKTVDKEKIVYAKFISYEETTKGYKIRFLVKSYKNIASFISD